ncbi:MAG: TRAP transporter substrate-binding protein [Halieaceae bacterium]|nr:TRAP transporter substrate-binding protein [Halieaceae bacterium]MCP5147420.1 TRAP transporter substrate-binding protein [Pseudomonadales bacterium]MCP5166069.1 TRAP transporter substrate-binding protein [Pseudomonadales bacterium]MCP5187248.1 TRAP transporter substrate-binding protein [Pseudomonadales bacterium]
MAASSFERRFSPLIILLLVAALVVTIGLWASGRAAQHSINTGVAGTAVGDEHFEWKMVTTWPKNFPGLGSAAENFARYMDEMSGGRLQVHVYGAGEIVPAFEVFDAVSQGVADAGHGAAYYWKGKIPSSVFFTAVPFGLNAQEINGWLHYGGGLELWREAYAPFNIIPFAGGNTGVQMAGWFNREINSIADLQGLKMRIPGLAGDVFAEAGGTAVRIPGGELYTSLQTGVIDATEWVGPYNDLALGLHEVAKYYYYPGWHEPGSMLELIVNKDSFEALPADLQAMVTVAARAANQDMLDEFTARNNAALQDLVKNHGVQLRRLPDDVLQALYQGSEKAMRELVAEDPMAARVYESYKSFYDGAREYHHISEQAYINARDVVIDGRGDAAE